MAWTSVFEARWWSFRRLTGLLAVGSLATGTVVAAGHTGDVDATAVRPGSETVWLLDADRRAIVLLDAAHDRPVTSVDVAPDTNVVAPVGHAALVPGTSTVMLLDGRTWHSAWVADTGADDLVVAGSSAAWLLSAAGTARRIEPDRTGPVTSPPVEVGTGIPAGRARVTGDGTLWHLSPDGIRGVRPDAPPVDVRFDRQDSQVLTLVDDQPVVIDHTRARRIDPVRAAVTAEWPTGLPPGPLVTAERSATVAVIHGGTLLARTGPDSPTTTVDLGVIPTEPPVEDDGRVYLSRGTHHDLLAVDATGTVTAIAPGGDGPVHLLAHHGRVWWSQRGPGPADDRLGVIDGVTTRTLNQARAEQEDARSGDRPPTGMTDDRTLPAPAAPPDPVGSPSGDVCARTWATTRCRPDGEGVPDRRPPAPGGGDDCPRTWPVASCTTRPANGVKESRPPGTVWFDWNPDPAVRGERVTFADRTPGTAGTRRWTFAGATPPTAEGPEATVVFDNGGPHRATLTVDGRPAALTREVRVVEPVRLPDLTGLTPEEAVARLRLAGLHLGHTRPAPGLVPAGQVVNARFQRRILESGAVVQPGWVVDLDVSDGTRPIRQVASSRMMMCAVTTDGLVSCWGLDIIEPRPSTFDEWSVVDSTDARPVPGLRATSVAVGDQHVCAVRVGGQVVCWGRNDGEQLGNGPGPDQPAPAEVHGVDGAVEVVTDDYRTCARRVDRSVWCWSFRSGGRDGLPRAVPGLEATALRRSGNTICAVTVETTIRCHRGDEIFEPLAPRAPSTPGTDPKPVTGVVDGGASGATSCVLRTDGHVYCDVPPHTLDGGPLPDLSGVTQVAMSDEHGCAVPAGGTVRCFGAGYHIHMADPTNAAVWVEPRIVSQLPADAPATGVFVGWFSSGAILDDGSAYWWGDPFQLVGALPSGVPPSFTASMVPQRIRLPAT